MDSIERQYEDLHVAAVKSGDADIYTAPNIGLRPDSDWYTDAVFGQQYLTGVNPTGLTQASSDWVAGFSQAASDQQNTAVQKILSTSPSSLYVVDNSDYRHILGLAANAPIISRAFLATRLMDAPQSPSSLFPILGSSTLYLSASTTRVASRRGRA